jgi:acyl carrier protein
MNDMATQQEIVEAIADHLGLPVADIDQTLSLQDDLGLNPVEKADLLHNLADRFQILIDRQETESIVAVGDLVELVEDKLLE